MPETQTPAPNPAIIEWARKEGGFTRERVARSLQVKPEQIEAWENRKRTPTVRQLEKLARFLRRPLSLFFLPKPPALAPLAADYRRLPGVRPGHESPELRLAVRQMLGRRENALNLMGELGVEVPRFRLAAHLSQSPEDVGRQLRAAIGIEVEEQASFPDAWQAWHGWRTAIEGLGLLVFQFPKVALDEVRGLVLPRAPLAVVAVNSKETVPQARVYTLLHEVVHLMLFVGREESTALDDRRPASEWNQLERFAEQAASHAFVPEAALAAIVEQVPRASAWSIAEMRQVARRFWITPLAMATRLRESGHMTAKAYREWREAWDAHVAALPPPRSGPSTPAQKTLGRSGRPFAQLVLEALSTNRINSVEAARYLDLKFEHFDELRERLVAGRIQAGA